jgi:hypothetical protein
MEDRAFDAIVRRIAALHPRRGLLRVIVGAAVAAGLQPLPGSAGNDSHDGDSGGHGRNKKKREHTKAEKNYLQCINYWFDYCEVGYTNPDVRLSCEDDFEECCALHLKGKDAAAINCVHFLDNEVW